MSLPRIAIPFLSFLFPLVCLANLTSAQVTVEPLCLVDTLYAAATDLDGLLHPFGQDTTTYTNEFSLPTRYPVFNKVFELYVTDGVSAQWSESEWEDFVSAIMDNDSTQTDDVFGIVWNYFTRDEADSNEYYSGVRYREFGVGQRYTKIRLRLYKLSDLDSPCTYGEYLCKGYSFPSGRGDLTLNAGIPMSEVLGFGVAHELQHLCWSANGYPGGYESANESMSTIAEYFTDTWRSLIYDFPYDSSVLRHEACDAVSKYQVERTWFTYLFETFKGDEGDPTDDLMYRWIRSNFTFAGRMRLDGLADILWDNDFDWVGGTDSLDRLHKVFGNYLVAKFANAPVFRENGEFGIGALNTVLDFGFFTDNCTWYDTGATPLSPVDCPENPTPAGGHAGCWNVRVLVPEHELVDDHENTLTAVSGIYEDGDAPLPTGDGDGSTDYVDVNMLGTDYVTFRADDYFDDAGEHELRIRLKGTFNKSVNPLFKEQFRVKPIGFLIGYSSESDTLQVHSESIVFVEPVTFTPATVTNDTTIMREVIVTDFGRSVKSVVLALGVVPPFINSSNWWTVPSSGFKYQYDFGVFTPGASSRTWRGDVYALGDVSVASGGTLDIDAGTHIKVFDSDLSEAGVNEDKIEINVEGELLADGTEANPIVFQSWKPQSSDDWVGVYFDSASDGGTFDHCVISGAEFAIESHVPLTLTNTVIDSCTMGVYSGAGGALIQGCQFNGCGSGIELGGGDMVIRNTTVDGALYNAVTVLADAPASLDVRNSVFMNSDVGLFVWGDAAVDVDSSSYFYANEFGIHFYETGSAPVVRNSFMGEDSVAVVCDQSSHPRIELNTIGFNGAGIYCSNSSSPIIEENQIQASGFAITATSSANPDVGHASPTGSQSAGNNSIAHTGKYVVNYNSSGTISAENNCWNKDTGSCLPASNMFTGSVDRDPSICCEFERWDDESIIEPEFTEGFVFHLPTGSPAEEPKAERAVTGLVSIVPNPFNPTTTISYGLAAQGKVEIKIYDVAGRLVQELANGTQTPGVHSAVWTGTDRKGAHVASGVYFVRMVAAGQVFTKKMVMLK